MHSMMIDRGCFFFLRLPPQEKIEGGRRGNPQLNLDIYKQKYFLHLIQQPKYEMVMPCKADYSPAKSFYDVKNLSGLI